MKFSVSTSFDFDGYIDYYSGHGHAFSSDNLIACLRFGPTINYKETVKEIIDAILEDLNSIGDPIEFLGKAENDKKLQDELQSFLTDAKLEESIRAQLKPETQDTDQFFYENPLEDTEEDPEEDSMLEYPQLIGFVHVYLEDQ